MMAMNTELEANNGSGRQNEDATLNTKSKKEIVTLNAKLKRDGGSERQNEDVALNAKMKKENPKCVFVDLVFMLMRFHSMENSLFI